MPRRENSLPFTVSPRFDDCSSYSRNWPSRYAPANDGSCNVNVAVDVLNKFNIPFVGSPPPLGRLCGLDINNMPAVDAIKLSLAENIANGQLYELYTDAYGEAYFQRIYPDAPVADLDLWLCVPTTDEDTKVDWVIVRGYDTPPVRECGTFVPVVKRHLGPLNPQFLPATQSYHCLDSLLGVSFCRGQIFSKEARVSYPDPILETAYGNNIDNLYNLDKFEQLIGYVIKFEGSTDPDVKYSHSDTSVFDLEINLQASQLMSQSLCSPEGEHSVSYVQRSALLPDFKTPDKYGDIWPLFNSVSQVSVIGYKIENIMDYTAFTGGAVVCYVSPDREIFSLSAGTNWFWELDKDAKGKVNIYYPVGEPGSLLRTIATLLSWPDVRLRKMGEPTLGGTTPDSTVGPGMILPNIGGTPGIVANKIIASVEIDRPSFTVQHAGGEALQYARNLQVEYQPIIVTDVPAPVAYTSGSGAKLVKHELDLWDSDPATVEIHPEERIGSLSWLQTQAQGNVVDVSLPFLSESQCIQFANTIYAMYEQEEESYQLVCGPSSKPKLGHRVEGLKGRINSIAYSYQDGSSYNINVTVGPTMSTLGGWDNKIWQKRTEDINREGIIVWTAGNGIDYLVKIQGFGTYPAVNTTLSAYAPGEKVQVTIHNNPVEA